MFHDQQLYLKTVSFHDHKIIHSMNLQFHLTLLASWHWPLLSPVEVIFNCIIIKDDWTVVGVIAWCQVEAILWTTAWRHIHAQKALLKFNLSMLKAFKDSVNIYMWPKFSKWYTYVQTNHFDGAHLDTHRDSEMVHGHLWSKAPQQFGPSFTTFRKSKLDYKNSIDNNNNSYHWSYIWMYRLLWITFVWVCRLTTLYIIIIW